MICTIFPSKLEKIRYKYYNVVTIYMQNQLYHEIQDIEIYQISKLKIKFRIKKFPKIEVILQKIIVLCNCKYCFKIRITYLIIVYMYIAHVKTSVNEIL